MQLTEADLLHLLEVACEAALAAGEVIAAGADSDFDIAHKDTGGSLATQVVTEIDLACDTLIRQKLESSAERYDFALLTEETPDDGARLEKDYFWCVDPLDGTLAFTRRQHGYSVAISLISKAGDPVIGVVFDPVKNNLYSAAKGQGAWLNRKPWCPDLKSRLNTLTVQLDCSFVESASFADKWTRLIKWARSRGYDEVRRETEGGGVMSAVWALEKAPGCYFKPPKVETGGGSSWDFAATACIFGELGAYARDYAGSTFHFNPPGSVYMNHCGVMFASTPDIGELAGFLEG